MNNEMIITSTIAASAGDDRGECDATGRHFTGPNYRLLLWRAGLIGWHAIKIC